jgi:membrane-bound lytic murein transglycosylase D
MALLMPTSKSTSLIRRSLAVTSSLLVLLTLTGCPDDRTRTAAPGSAPTNATAPTLQKQQVPNQAQAQAQTQAQQSANQIIAAQHAQKVQAVIAKTQASYQSGVANYNANRLDAARRDFDTAVDTMLSSGMDLKEDPQLSEEFDQLLSAINSLEMVALKQGNGFSGQIEEAPAEAANQVTFASNPELVTKITQELKTTQSDLPLVVNDYVAGWINYFTNSPAGHAHLARSLERAGKYRAMISKDLAAQGVPQDLIYLAVAESGFQPQVVNAGSGAGGMWQFMPFRGAYGLERNGFFDERFDPEQSTLAYARYMKSLYNQFGDWYLAMAAYNWGPGNVQHAVAKTGYADFWQLYRLNALPGATKNYVPSIIAAAIMAKNPKQYGLTDVVPDAAILSDEVTTNYAIDMRLVADLTNATLPEIVALNPALLRLTTPNDVPYGLHLPPGTRDIFLTRLKNIPEADRTSWRFHVVKPGETLDQIAESLHAHPSEITTFNDITEPIEAGDELVIPIAASSHLTPGQRYTVRRNDTLVTVADRFGVTVEQLRAWNHLSSNHVAPGHSLYVVEPIRLAPAVHEHRHHEGHTASHSTSATRHGHVEEHTSAHTAAHSTSHPASHAHTTPSEKKNSKKKKSSK